MPTICKCCASRLRRDKTCRTAGCTGFRPSARGTNFAKKRVRQRCKGPQTSALAADHHRSTKPQLTPKADGKLPPQLSSTEQCALSPEATAAQDVQVKQVLRTAALEELLTDMFGEADYFTILSLAHRQRSQSDTLSLVPLSLCVWSNICTMPRSGGC